MKYITHGAAILLFLAASWAFAILTDDPGPPRRVALEALAILGILTWVVGTLRGRNPLRGVGAVEASLLAFIAYYALSLLWTPDSREGGLEFVTIIVMAVIFVGSRYALLIAPLLATAGILWLWHELPEIWAGFGNENFLTEWLLIVLPFCLAGCFTRLKWLGIPTSLGCLWWLAFVSNSDTVKAGLAGLLLALAILLWINRKGFWAAALLLVPLNLAFLTGWATSHEVVRAIGARLEMTYNTLSAWVDSPFIGWGAGSYNYVYPLYGERHLGPFPWADTTLRPVNVFSGFAHDEYAQILMELGLAGACLLAITGFLIVRRLKERRWDWLDLGAMGSVIVSLPIMGIGFPLHNPHTALLIVFALGVLSRNGERCVSYPRRWPWRWQSASGRRGISRRGRSSSLPSFASITRRIRGLRYWRTSRSSTSSGGTHI